MGGQDRRRADGRLRASGPDHRERGLLDRAEDRTSRDRASQENPTNVPDSYDSYLQGIALASRGQGAEARLLFKRAIEQDSGYAAAHAMAAYTYLIDQSQHGAIADPAMRADAVALANAALKLTDQDAFVLARSAKPSPTSDSNTTGGVAGGAGDRA